MGMPLPNNGYYGNCPVDALRMALCHTVHLTDALSAALHITLPHRLYPFQPMGPLISPQNSATDVYAILPIEMPSNRDSLRDFQWITIEDIGQYHMQDSSSNSSSSSQYSINENFQQAFSLLCVDILVLCVGVGLTPADLFPPQALLLNLHLIERHCRERLVTLEGFDRCTTALAASLSHPLLDEVEQLEEVLRPLCWRYLSFHPMQWSSTPSVTRRKESRDEEEWQWIDSTDQENDKPSQPRPQSTPSRTIPDLFAMFR
eukprot:gene3007-3281_t